MQNYCKTQYFSMIVFFYFVFLFLLVVNFALTKRDHYCSLNM